MTAEGNTLKEIRFVHPDERLPRFDKNDPVLNQACRALQLYFRKEVPDLTDLPMDPEGTVFQKTVWNILREIPYGETRTYKEIAEETAKRLGKQRMSSQAVGQALRANPIPILIPCHRVLGFDGSLVGYRYGIEKKEYLLRLEGIIKGEP